MKKIIIILFSIFFTCLMFAHNFTVESICNGLSLNPNTTGDFIQIKTINSNGRQLKSSGTFIISTEGLMWKTLKPFPSCLTVTKNSMMQSGMDGKVTVMSGSDNQIFQNIADTLSSVFAGDSETLKKNFDTQLFESQNGVWSIILTPKDSVIAYVMQNLVLSGNENKSQIILDSLELIETSSNKIRYEFFNQKYPKELTEDEKANFKIN